MKVIDQRNGQASILNFMQSVDDRRQDNNAFQTRQQETWRAALHTSSNMVDGDQSSEEPRTKFARTTHVYFLCYIQVLILTFVP